MITLISVTHWIYAHEIFLVWLGTLSIVTLVLSLIVLPFLVAGIPEDYFLNQRQNPSDFRMQHPLLGIIFHIGKNTLGVVFVLAGTAMLVLPGQGLITIFIGISLLNFPGKRKLERFLVQLPGLLATINWMRSRTKHPPLIVPGHSEAAAKRNDHL
ncbi:MAG: hypothetical protein JW920_09920 [Deltaproteobacteria bacterium]|nr:hypothetical protein [Deltaproteobacteria bacterium]